MTRKKRYLNKKVLLATLLILVAAGAVFLIRSGHQSKAVSGTIPSSAPEMSSSNVSAPAIDKTKPTSSTAPSNPSGSTAASTTSGPTLTQGPSGSFVSNHKPSLSGSPTPSQEESLCNTMPGASCYIEFTQGGIVKKLDSKVADASGTVIWDWDVKKAGFTAGSWSIKAITTLNGQTKSTVDPLMLEVQE